MLADGIWLLMFSVQHRENESHPEFQVFAVKYKHLHPRGHLHQGQLIYSSFVKIKQLNVGNQMEGDFVHQLIQLKFQVLREIASHPVRHAHKSHK